MFGRAFEQGDRVWVELTDIGPPDTRRGTIVISRTSIDEHGWLHDFVSVLLDGADKTTGWLGHRVYHLNALELLAEVE